MKIALASDHKGYKLKKEIIQYLNQNHEILDLGTHSEESTDFPLYGIKIGEKISKKEADLGIAICGTGIGISIAANKVKGVMCAKINTKEEARLAKEHNRANILALSGILSKEEAIDMINTFLNTNPLEDEKYLRRINQIKDYENDN